MNLERFLEPGLHLPPHETLATLANNPDYLLAGHYFLLNMGLLILAWLLGGAGIQLINRMLQQDHSTLHHYSLPVSATVFFRIVTGVAIMIATIFLLALFQCLEAGILLPILGLLASVAVVLQYRTVVDSRESRSPGKWLSWGVLTDSAFLLMLVLILFSLPTSPSIGDSTSFHAPYARFFLQNHGLAVHEHLIYPYHTFNLNIFYSMGLMLVHDITYLQTLHGMFAILAMLGLYGFARAMRLQPLLCLLLPLIFIELYFVRYNIIYANVDLGGMCFAFATFFALWCWGETKNRTYLAVAAICLGIAMGTKYILCAMIPPAIIALYLLDPEKFVRNAVFCALWLLAWGSWWYLRNAILIGNPVHPFATSIFGSQLWSEADMASQLSASNKWIPRSLLGLLFLPSHAYQSEVLLPQDVCAVIFLMFFSTFFSRLLPLRTNMLLIAAWCWTVSWVWGSQDPRHFLPAVPLVLLHAAALASNELDGIGAYLGKCLRLEKRPVWGLLGKVALTLPVVLLAVLLTREKLVRVYVSHVSPDVAYEGEVRLRLPVYDTIMAANSIFSENETVYEFGNRDGYWFFKGKLVGTQFGPHGYWSLAEASTKPGFSGMQPDQLQKVMQERYQAAGIIIPHAPYFPYNQASFDTYFQLMYRGSGNSVYRFKDRP